MQLQTERLLIRDWQPSHDAADAFAIYGDERVMQWIGDRTLDPDQAATQARLERYQQRTATSEPRGTGTWAIVARQDDRVIGNVLLVPLPNRQRQPSGKVEIGWHLNPAYWGQGFATETAKAILRYGFEQLELPHIYAVTYPDNVRSQAVTRRLGMVSLGLSQEYYGGIALSLFVRSRDSWPTSLAPDGSI